MTLVLPDIGGNLVRIEANPPTPEPHDRQRIDRIFLRTRIDPTRGDAEGGTQIDHGKQLPRP
jgi:hypothetical protein